MVGVVGGKTFTFFWSADCRRLVFVFGVSVSSLDFGELTKVFMVTYHLLHDVNNF